MNVLVIKYFPLTEDRRYIDRDITGWDPSFMGEGPAPYDVIKQNTVEITNTLVTLLEKASKYLGYNDSSAKPALDYSVIDTIEHEEAVPISPQPDRSTYPDYNGIMLRHNICNYVDTKNV